MHPLKNVIKFREVFVDLRAITTCSALEFCSRVQHASLVLSAQMVYDFDSDPSKTPRKRNEELVHNSCGGFKELNASSKIRQLCSAVGRLLLSQKTPPL